VNRSQKKPQHFTDLLVWQEAHQLVLQNDELIDSFPERERFTLLQQVIRSVVSVPANIAAWFKRQSSAGKIRFSNIAQASLAEVKYHLDQARDLGFIQTDLWKEIDRIDSKLRSPVRPLRS